MKKPAFPSDQQDKFMLRLPDGMRDRIKAAADANNRSMNAEIVATLEEKYPAIDLLDFERFRTVLRGMQLAREQFQKSKDPEERAKFLAEFERHRTGLDAIQTALRSLESPPEGWPKG